MALPASAKARWDQESGRCTMAGTMILSTHELLTIGPGVTLVVDGRLTNQGVINNAFGATLLDKGKITNEGTITNMETSLCQAQGHLATKGFI